MNHISISASLLNRKQIDPILKQLVTGDEKRVASDNVKRKRLCSKRGEPEQTVAKPGLTVKKVLLCVFGAWQIILYYELLFYHQILNSNLLCEQLNQL